jgi:hypothetical protein
MAAALVDRQHRPKQNATVPSQHQSEVALVKHFTDALCESA